MDSHGPRLQWQAVSLLLQTTPIEGKREKIGKAVFLVEAAEGMQVNPDVATIFPKQLPAGAARRIEAGGIGHDRDLSKLTRTFAEGFPQSHALRTNRQSI